MSTRPESVEWYPGFGNKVLICPLLRMMLHDRKNTYIATSVIIGRNQVSKYIVEKKHERREDTCQCA